MQTKHAFRTVKKCELLAKLDQINACGASGEMTAKQRRIFGKHLLLMVAKYIMETPIKTK